MNPMLMDTPFVKAYRNRHGKVYYYLRRRGHKPVRLTGKPGSPEFIASYHAALNRDKPATAARSVAQGSFEALVREYTASADFSQLAESTRREMKYVLNALCVQHGEKRVAKIERRHIIDMKDALRSKPGAANKMLRTLRQLMSYAVLREYLPHNPTTGVKLMKLGSWRAWTMEERKAFEAKWPLGTLERTGYALALYTGQRRTDLAKLKWSNIAGNAFRLTQGKTNAVLEVPIHPDLRDALAAVNPRHEAAILTTEKGAALNPIYFGHLMASAIAEAGLPDKCVLHGLRKSATAALIDAGCTPHQASAITGHKTIRMLEEYAKQRDQVKLGKAAMLKWRRAK